MDKFVQWMNETLELLPARLTLASKSGDFILKDGPDATAYNLGSYLECDSVRPVLTIPVPAEAGGVFIPKVMSVLGMRIVFSNSHNADNAIDCGLIVLSAHASQLMRGIFEQASGSLVLTSRKMGSKQHSWYWPSFNGRTVSRHLPKGN